MSKMSGKGVQNGGRMWTERTKQTGEKSQAPIRPMRPIGPIRLMKTRCRTCVQNEGTRCPEWGLVVVASVPDGGFTPLRSSLKTIYTHVQNEVNRCPKWGSPLCGSAPLAGPATAGKKRGQVESEDMEPENTSQTSQSSHYSQTHYPGLVSSANAGKVSDIYPFFSDFPVLPGHVMPKIMIFL